MTDCTIDGTTVETHARALTTIVTTVRGAGTTASSSRLGGADYGAMFCWLAACVNDALDEVSTAIAAHAGELEAHRAGFVKNIEANRTTDRSGGGTLTEAGAP